MMKQLRVNGLQIGYTVRHREVAYPRLEFKTGRLLVVLPRYYRDERELLEKHTRWIYKKEVMIRRLIQKGEHNGQLVTRSDAQFRRMVLST